MFLWDRGRNNVLTGTLKLKIPWNLQTCKVVTPILHLVINTLQRKRLRTYFKPNGSTIFKVYQNFGHIFSLNPVEIYVTLDLPEHSMSPLTIYFPYGQTQVATEEKRSRAEFVWYLTWIKLKVKSIFYYNVHSLISKEVIHFTKFDII